MATTAQSIILDAQTALQDLEGTRWSATELVRHLNRGQQDIRNARPDTTAEKVQVTLVSGYRQSIPDTAADLIDIPNNTNGAAITKTDLVQLDAVSRGWRTSAQKGVVVHFMHDARRPREFEVYPPALGGTSVDMEVSSYPADVGVPTAPGLTFASVSGNIGLQDKWSTALLSMVLHYAYAKDAEYGGNAALSAAYLQKAQGILGAEIQTRAAMAPKS